MQGNYGSVIVHIQSGMKILSEVKYNESNTRHEHRLLGDAVASYLPMTVLEEIFARIDLRATQVGFLNFRRSVG